jgi:hypothetical protein
MGDERSGIDDWNDVTRWCRSLGGEIVENTVGVTICDKA